MEFRILGPVEVVHAEHDSVAAGGGKQRALLAYLLLHANDVVPRDRLVDALWGERPPNTVDSMLHLYLSRLRKLLAGVVGAELVTRAPGYVLEVDPASLDAERFRRLVAQGRAALDTGKAADAVSRLEEALALWRGPALADVGDADWARSEAARLEELRLEAVTSKLEAELQLGNHALVVGELEELVEHHPLNERLRALLMVALYRSGRQAEALDAYRRGRRLLVDELGLEPGRELREVERAILRQDPSLAPTSTVREPAPARPERHERPRWRALAVGAVLAFLAVAAAGFAVNRELVRPAAAGARENVVVIVDPRTNEVERTIAVGARPAAIAVAGTTVWVANVDDASVSRIDADRMKTVRTIALPQRAHALAADADGVWAAADGSKLYRIERAFDAVVRTLSLRRRARVFNVEPLPGAALGGGALWTVSGTGVVRMSPASGKTLDDVQTGDDPTAVAYGEGAAWVADAVNNTVTRVDPAGSVQRLTVGRRPTAVSVGAGAAWVASALDDTVVRIDPATRSVTAAIPVGRAPSGIAVGAGAVWVANSGDGTVSRIDPAKNEVVETIDVGGSPAGIVAAGSAVWVTLQERLELGKSGGSALVVLREDPGGLDPAITFWDWSWQVLYATCVKLMNYPDQAGPAGLALVPEAAASAPTVLDGGRTYVFSVPARFRFSPPSDEAVTATTFKRTIERATSPRTKSEFAAWFLRDVVGMPGYRAGKTQRLAGVQARGETLTIRLTRPSFDLPARLALPFFCAVPTRTPIVAGGLRVVPSAGPYYVASYAPGRRLVLRRNPSYRGSRPRRLDRIVYAIGASRRDGVGDVERGAADHVADGLPAADAKRLRARFRRAGDPTGGGRLLATPTRLVSYFALNVRRPVFARARMRKAVNYALDRPALIRAAAAASAGAPGGRMATDQYLSPAVPGFLDAEIYPLEGPDVERARRLAGGRRGSVVLYTCTTSPCLEEAEVLRRNLRAIGLRLRVKRFPLALLYEKMAEPGAPFDIGHYAWIPDYPDPANVVGTLFRGGSDWYPGGFDDARWNRRLDRASRLTGSARYRAYGLLDAELARDDAPAAAIAYHVRYDFFSRRVGCRLAHPVYGVDLGSLCLRP